MGAIVIFLNFSNK